MKLDLELDDALKNGPNNELDELIDSFQRSPDKVSKAIQRSLRKLSRFAERRTLRELSRQQGITQKRLKQLGRVKVSPSSLSGQGGANEIRRSYWPAFLERGFFDAAGECPPSHGVQTQGKLGAQIPAFKEVWPNDVDGFAVGKAVIAHVSKRGAGHRKTSTGVIGAVFYLAATGAQLCLQNRR